MFFFPSGDRLFYNFRKKSMKQEMDNEDRNAGEIVENITIKTEKKNICYGCGVEITDRFLLKAGVSEVWHLQCLRCSHCYTRLQAFGTCFLRGRDVYCRKCYSSQFDRTCSGCCRVISPRDWVRRARNHVYHLACFACDHCKRQLSTGEEFAMIGHYIRCRLHFYDTRKRSDLTGCESDSDTGSNETFTDDSSSPKPKRIRTTFTEKQLDILHAHFKVDVNPDSNTLQRIAHSTGLSKRVTQVWFQNSRARQKKCGVSSKHSALQR